MTKDDDLLARNRAQAKDRGCSEYMRDAQDAGLSPEDTVVALDTFE